MTVHRICGNPRSHNQPLTSLKLDEHEERPGDGERREARVYSNYSGTQRAILAKQTVGFSRRSNPLNSLREKRKCG